MVDYFDEQTPDAKNVVMLKSTNQDKSYYAVYGWTPISGLKGEDVPNANTRWTLMDGNTLTERSPITLQWKNKKGVTFQRRISIDENFMFSITQSVFNDSETKLRLAPYGIIARHGKPDTIGFYILHEGVLQRKTVS